MLNTHKVLFPTLVLSIGLFLFSYISLSLFLYVIVIVGSILSLLLQNRTHYMTLMWIYILILFPVIGYMFYLFSGQLEVKGELFKNKRTEWKTYFQEQRKDLLEIDMSYYDSNVYEFIKFAQNNCSTCLSNYSEVEVFSDGKSTIEDMLKSIKRARQFILVEFYIFRTDETGILFLEQLINKAKEGVKVYFIVDAIGSLNFFKEWKRTLEENNIQIQFFSPIRLSFFNQKLNFRNHRKIIVIDNDYGYIGGLNIGNEYASLNKEIGYWRDTHMKVTGEVVSSLFHIFLQDWAYCTGALLPIHFTPKRLNISDGAIQVVATGPDTKQGLMGDYYFQLLINARKSIWIASPYFVPNEAIRTCLRNASLKGIDVKILLPRKNDRFLTEYASQSYFGELLACGIEIYLYEKGFLHQKVIIVDEMMASIGTANVDMRSFHLNFEANVFLYQNSKIRKLTQDFLEDLKVSTKLSPSQFYKRSIFIKLKESVARLFSGAL